MPPPALLLSGWRMRTGGLELERGAKELDGGLALAGGGAGGEQDQERAHRGTLEMVARFL